jgi:hypothetical protein
MCNISVTSVEVAWCQFSLCLLEAISWCLAIAIVERAHFCVVLSDLVANNCSGI